MFANFTSRVRCTSLSTIHHLLRPKPLNSIRCYYVKPKKKSGGTIQAWAALAAVTVTVAGGTVMYFGRPDDEVAGLGIEDKHRDEPVVMAYLKRVRDRITDFRKTFTEPSSVQLLPDHLPYPYQRPYTLILDLNHLLIYSDYDRQVGWRHQKRPGLDYMLDQLVDYYELVIFTSDVCFTAAPIIEKMDPKHYTMYHLYRDSTKYSKGHHVKDLTNLNRSLNKVIIVDTDPHSVSLQPENSIILDKWTGDIYDRTLYNLVPFLLTIASSGVDDVRTVLDHYKSIGGKDVLESFKLNQAKFAEEQERRKSSKQQHRGFGGKFSTFSLGSAMKQPVNTLSEETDIPPVGPTLPPVTDTNSTQEETQDSSWSVVGWVGSWLGWK